MLTRLRSLIKNAAAWSFIPPLCFVVFPALIVRVKQVVVLEDATGLWGDSLYGDTRSWWKAVFVVGIAAWMGITVVLRLLDGWRPKRLRMGLFVLAAAAGVAAATWASPFPYTRWAGYTGAYEGAIVFAAYLLAFWYVSETSEESERLLVARSVVVVAAVNIALGIMAGVNADFWRTSLGAWVIGADKSSLVHTFAGTNMASGTAFQPNHYGMLMAMVGALAMGMIWAEKKGLWRNIWAGIYVFSIITLLFSRSRAGTMVLGALTLVMIFVKANEWRKASGSGFRLPKIGPKKLAIAASVALVVAALFALLGFGDAARMFLQRSARLFTPTPLNSEIADVGLEDNTILVKTRSGMVKIGKLSATSWYTAPENARRSILQFAPGKDGWRTAQIPGLDKTSLRINQFGNAVMAGPDTSLEFFALGAELFAVDKTRMNLRLRTEVPFSNYRPNGWEGFLSARGYIWVRCLEKWLERPWFGWGPGSVPLVFPNEELLNKKRYSFGDNEDKAHSIPLTFLVQTGIIGTILYFLPFGYAVYALARSGARLRLPLLLAMAAYILCGLTNDSTAGVTPLFCVFAGLAVAEAKDKTPTA